ncbi:hypothetical protein FEM49_03391 (plasmid) [Lactiplantibacillus plantarum]|nr:hypothetical protein FEM49_03391 [Lactiplantibacillus plantarum]
MNIPRHDQYSIINPPTHGPTAAANAATAPIRPTAALACFLPTKETHNGTKIGVAIAPPIPCRALAAINMIIDTERLHSNEPIPNKHSPKMMIFFRPN